jgi:cation diffusion facilitator CzcD-associated flavoprotein CzcO
LTAPAFTPGPTTAIDVPHTRVAIIGSGFGGLAAGRALKVSGRHDFLIFERAGEVGGAWRDNTYPGAACDVPSHLYSFSFTKNPGWTRSFPLQPELERYLQRVAAEEGLLPHLRFHHEVVSIRWNPTSTRWTVETSGGTFTADVVVTAAGALSDPKLPDVPGIERFRGEIFHSSQWRHDVDLTGKRVAAIGTGASAIQFVPAIQPKVAELHLFQRTAAWLIPRVDRKLSKAERSLYQRFPMADRIARLVDYTVREAVWMPAFVWVPPLHKTTRWASLAMLRRQVKDPALRAKLTPDYTTGCKRILISNQFFPAVAQPNVEVHTTGLSAVTESTVIGADGTEREVDAIIFGTGFQVTDLPITHRIFDGAGKAVSDHWQQNGMEALRGTTIAGYPNLFMVVGPNTGLGHTSMIFMIESQVNYLMDAIRKMEEHDLAAVEPSAKAQQQWNSWVHERLQRTVWVTGGCVSWYQDARGRITQLWPASTVAFRRMTKRFDLAEYDVQPRPVITPMFPHQAPPPAVPVSVTSVG